VIKLTQSIQLFNREKIPFYISIPLEDVDILRKEFKKYDIKQNKNLEIITDEEIIKVINGMSIDKYKNLSGGVGQQIIKAEVWRYLKCKNYLCIDSDSEFRKDFYKDSFFYKDTNNLLTVFHDARDFLEEANKNKKIEIIKNYIKDSNIMKNEFGRFGEDYDFGPQPLLWSASVWLDLYEKHLKLKEESIAEAIQRIPMEIRWYGEALLKFKTIPLHSVGPLFKVYHYKWQKKSNDNDYLGVVEQSNWNKKLDYKQGICDLIRKYLTSGI
jgi:hypothetical protein